MQISIYLSIYLSIDLSIYLGIGIYTYIYTYLPVHVYRYLHEFLQSTQTHTDTQRHTYKCASIYLCACDTRQRGARRAHTEMRAQMDRGTFARGQQQADGCGVCDMIPDSGARDAPSSWPHPSACCSPLAAAGGGEAGDGSRPVSTTRAPSGGGMVWLSPWRAEAGAPASSIEAIVPWLHARAHSPRRAAVAAARRRPHTRWRQERRSDRGVRSQGMHAVGPGRAAAAREMKGLREDEA